MTRVRADWVTLAFLTLVALLPGMLAPTSAPPMSASTAALSPSLPTLLEATAVTLARVLLVLILTLVAAVPLGLRMASDRPGARWLAPTVRVFTTAPALGLLCLMIAFLPHSAPAIRWRSEAIILSAAAAPAVLAVAHAIGIAIDRIPKELSAAARGLAMTPWQRIWRLEVPFSIPAASDALRASLPACWMVLTAGEMFLARTDVFDGLGGFAVSGARSDAPVAVILAAVALGMVVLMSDRLVVRPLAAWSLRFDPAASARNGRNIWLLTIWRRQRFLALVSSAFQALLVSAGTLRIGRPAPARHALDKSDSTAGESMVPWTILIALLACILALVFQGGGDVALVLHLLEATVMSMARVFICCAIGMGEAVLIAIAWRGHGPFAAGAVTMTGRAVILFPLNILFPLMAAWVVGTHMQAGPWLTALLIPGACIPPLLAVSVGISRIPADLTRAARNLGLSGPLLWRRLVLPAVALPLADGALASFTWCWNAMIVTDALSWGDTSVSLPGIGSMCAHAAIAGDLPHCILALGAATAVAIGVRRYVWEPMRAQLVLRFALPDRTT